MLWSKSRNDGIGRGASESRRAAAAHEKRYEIKEEAIMKKTFYLEGERVTRKHVKELIGEERFMHIMDEALEAFETDPAEEISYMTSEGILSIEFQLT